MTQGDDYGLTEEVLSDGRTVWRDIEGKIRKTTLPPELAGRMGSIANARRSDRSDDIQALLAELSLDSTSARLLAENFVKGGAGAVGAARELFRMSRGYTSGEPGELQDGQPCPLCGSIRGSIILTESQVNDLLAYVRVWHEQNEEKQDGNQG